MITANLQLIANVLEAPSAQSIQTLFEDGKTVFWVDAREEEESIVQYVETKLGTGTLSSEVVDADTEAGYEMYIRYNNKRLKVPLTASPRDRHIAIFSINRILHPDYEIRFFTPSAEMDSLAFVA